MSDKNSLGMVQVETDKVIAACIWKIESIGKHRSRLRREYCQGLLASYTKNWQMFWRWFGFPKPTLRDAIYSYYYSEHPRSCIVNFCYGLQEQDCEDLLRSAKSTASLSMWVSTEGVKACRL